MKFISHLHTKTRHKTRFFALALALSIVYKIIFIRKPRAVGSSISSQPLARRALRSASVRGDRTAYARRVAL